MGSAAEREHWFPVAFAGELDETTMIPFDLFNVPWVAFRDEKGSAGCIKDECAHRALPRLPRKARRRQGAVPVSRMGIRHQRRVREDALHQEDASQRVRRRRARRGARWLVVRVGRPMGRRRRASAASKLPDFAPPPGFAVMAEVTVEIPMDADEVLARLMAPGGRASAAEMVAFERVNVELSDDVFPKMVAGRSRAPHARAARGVLPSGARDRVHRGARGRTRELEHPSDARGVADATGKGAGAVQNQHGFRGAAGAGQEHRGDRCGRTSPRWCCTSSSSTCVRRGRGGRRTRWRRRATRSGCGRCPPTDSMRRIVREGRRGDASCKTSYYSCDFPVLPADSRRLPADSLARPRSKPRHQRAAERDLHGMVHQRGEAQPRQIRAPSNSALMSGRPNARSSGSPCTPPRRRRASRARRRSRRRKWALYATRSAAKIAKSALTSPAATPNPPLKVLQKVL